MRILRVDAKRHFIAYNDADMHNFALKVLNEKRILLDKDTAEYEFVSAVCDEMDGENALLYLMHKHDVDIIAPEVL